MDTALITKKAMLTHKKPNPRANAVRPYMSRDRATICFLLFLLDVYSFALKEKTRFRRQGHKYLLDFYCGE